MKLNARIKSLLMIAVFLFLIQTIPVQAADIDDISGLKAGAEIVLSTSSPKSETTTSGELVEQAEGEAASSVSEPKAETVAESVSESATEFVAESEIPGYEGKEIAMAKVNDSANVRVEPNEEAELAGKLYKGCVAEITGEEGDWTQIKSGNLSGYIKNDYLYFGDEAEQIAKEEGKLTAKVTTDTLRIREEADEDSSIYGLLGKGEEIEALEDDGDWVKVCYEDETEGYIASDYVSLSYEIDQGETVEEIEEREETEKKKKIEASRTTETTTTNSGAVAAQTDDVTLLAALIQCESGWEPYEGKLAVGAVVVNRARGRYGSIFNAVYAPGQFGPAASGKVAAVVAMGPSASCMQAASDAINGTTNVGAATHFRNVRSGYPGIVIGNHVFW